MKIFLITLSLFSFSAKALETDNYLVWNKELKDASDQVNSYIVEQINSALLKSHTSKKELDCESITFEIAERFAPNILVQHPIEVWAKTHLDPAFIYPKNGNYIPESIYRDPFALYLKLIPLSPNIQINGIYQGTDKLTHFMSTGRRYLKRYLKDLSQGYSDLEAQKRIVIFGLDNEDTFLGMMTSGVFSYGDVEANYQGFLFYKKMCLDQHNTFLSQDSSGKWHLTTPPDIRDYVTPYWDETFHLPYRVEKNWQKVSKVLKQQYCPMKDRADVKARIAYYQSFKKVSFSLEYIKKLQLAGYHKAPDPLRSQSFDKLCE